MKSIFFALALIATGVQAAEDADNTPCDAVENDVQTLECSAYNKTTAEQLLKDNYQGLLERFRAEYANNKSQLADITSKLQVAEQLWVKSRDADCTIAPFPAAVGSKAYLIDQNDCLANKSDERSEFLESLAQ
ncbi:lysozyme inhibitor LprI family protein [Pseudomonas sp. Irchel 3H3]|uniref:lysozyme inhibitor LprI family protein n=1 Tax=unclassified Pseudomonas TaxID=196821 RepID=UPI000BA4BD14|nr:lysozyme inhibitor LprI family protein [Pseudomonas sp. Irchel 3H3]